MQKISRQGWLRKWMWISGLFSLWILMLVFVYWYFIVKPQQWFDSKMVHPHPLYDVKQQVLIRQEVHRLYPDLLEDSVWFVRFKQSGCGCERFVELYHQSFANQTDFKVASIDLDSTDLNPSVRNIFRQWVSATPAALVFQADGTVAYFGPYHQEGVCNAENSYLEPVLQQLAQGELPSVMNTLVYGCFCSVK